MWWEAHGYLAGKCIDPDTDLWVCLAPMIFTYRLMLCTPTCVHGFACYEPRLGLAFAMAAFQKWDGRSAPPAGYTRIHALEEATERKG